MWWVGTQYNKGDLGLFKPISCIILLRVSKIQITNKVFLKRFLDFVFTLNKGLGNMT